MLETEARRQPAKGGGGGGGGGGRGYKVKDEEVGTK